MKCLAVIIPLFFALHSFAQSKKKINEQLNAELALTKSEVDSITTLASRRAAQLLIKQRDFAAAQLRNTQRQGTDLMDALTKLEKHRNQGQLLRP